MRYFEQERQNWIKEILRIFGFIQRAHLVRKFGISIPQASHDIQVYQKENPGDILYQPREKMYVWQGNLDYEEK